MESRFIGIIHRVKETKAGAARPTLVAIKQNGSFKQMSLKDEDAELAFVQESVQPNDKIAMMLGGSGDRLAASIGKKALSIGAELVRIPAFVVQQYREEYNIEAEKDHFALVRIAREHPEACYGFRALDHGLILVKELYYARQEAQDARIQCENRIRARLIGRIFLSEDGGFPEGKLEDLFDSEKANDKILQALLTEERQRNRDLRAAVQKLDVWKHVFAPIEGCGEIIAAGIIAAVGDVRRFKTAAKLKAFCGVHVNDDGTFVRRRSGKIANWHPEARQSLYQLVEQFNRRPTSEWGVKLRENKTRLREAHPEVEVVNGKKRYTDGHIHKMGMWRTITHFTEMLHAQWTKLERS